MNLKDTIYLALLVAIALAISLLESLIPLPFVAPGAKLGLSNIVILVTLVTFGFKEGMIVSVLKSFLLMLVTGGVTSFLYSLAGALLSTIIMWLAYRYMSKYLSLIGVSILGAVAHNFAQVTVASLLLGNIMVYTYLPILIFIGLFTGYFVGISSDFVSKKLKRVITLGGDNTNEKNDDKGISDK